MPINKSGDTNEPHNYRPISILSVFSKVLERLVYNQLDNFLEKYNIMYYYQFGFRKKQGRINAHLTGGVQISLGGGVHWCATKGADPASTQRYPNVV